MEYKLYNKFNTDLQEDKSTDRFLFFFFWHLTLLIHYLLQLPSLAFLMPFVPVQLMGRLRQQCREIYSWNHLGRIKRRGSRSIREKSLTAIPVFIPVKRVTSLLGRGHLQGTSEEGSGWSVGSLKESAQGKKPVFSSWLGAERLLCKYCNAPRRHSYQRCQPITVPTADASPNRLPGCAHLPCWSHISHQGSICLDFFSGFSSSTHTLTVGVSTRPFLPSLYIFLVQILHNLKYHYHQVLIFCMFIQVTIFSHLDYSNDFLNVLPSLLHFTTHPFSMLQILGYL